MDEVDVTIIGAGVVGLATAAELSNKCDSVLVLERHEHFGQETSSRNSEVIHSGIYYEKDSLKARLCVDGAELLYKYCEQNSIPYSRLGKLIVATEQEELRQLDELIERGKQNGVRDLILLEKGEITRREPNVSAIKALCSPNTGIVDSHSLMKQLYNSARSSGALFSFGSEVNMIEKTDKGYILGLKDDEYRFLSKTVINSAGLSSDHIAELAGIDIDATGYRLRYCKGSYFSYAKKSPVSMLVYPLPQKDLSGLGVHATLDLGGRLRFGPDAEYVTSIEYQVDERKRYVFFGSASQFIEGLEKNAFIPDTAGIRPQIAREGARDFIIRDEADQGLPGFINLIGIESPGLTACLAIAAYIRDSVLSSAH